MVLELDWLNLHWMSACSGHTWLELFEGVGTPRSGLSK